MTRSAPVAFDWNRWLIALLVIGSIRWLGDACLVILNLLLRHRQHRHRCPNSTSRSWSCGENLRLYHYRRSAQHQVQLHHCLRLRLRPQQANR